MKNALPEADPVDFIFGSRELLFCSSKANFKKKKRFHNVKTVISNQV